jgi:malate dehydrogenase (oxaloacetate-decarboxylating)(NADP+)
MSNEPTSIAQQPAVPLEIAKGVKLLHDPLRNKGTAFTEAERDALGLHGLLPPRVLTMAAQASRIMENFAKKPDDLEKYIHLINLEDRNEALFYRVVVDNIEKVMPIIYTPTVGKACQQYGQIFQRPRGIFISRRFKGRVAEVLRNWPTHDVRVIVVTDGERILGLGDQGAQGMGIPVGKLSLYSACAGVPPWQTLPITLDVGTNNELLRNDPFYIGDPLERLRGQEYDDFLEEFVLAVQEAFPKALLQFEDFATRNAFALLERYRERVCTFNDDIQGTAAVALAGLYSAMRITGGRLRDQQVLFLGAGEAAVGIADLFVAAIREKGVEEADASRRCWLFDSQGLVVSSRTDLAEHKIRYAHDHEPMSDFLAAVRAFEPTAIIGVSGQPNTFTPEIVGTMAELNERPIVFALSNPTSKAECTAAEAYRHSQGRAIFASGSPFDPVTLDGRTHVPGQGNNAYIFPGVGLGVIVSGARLVTDAMFFVAAKVLAHEVREENLEAGCIYPTLSRIREVSAVIARAVAEVAWDRGLTEEPRPEDILTLVRSRMYEPTYTSYV